MRAVDTLLAGRRLKESLMNSECVIQRDTGETTRDPVSLEQVPVMVPVYEGPCRVKSPQTSVGTREVPGVVVTQQSLILDLPISWPGSDQVTTNDVWTCTANVIDPLLVGRSARVAGRDNETYATSRRFPLEETS